MRSVVLDGEKDAPAGRVKALDELLDFPHLNILFRLVLTHFSTDTRPLNSSEEAKVDEDVVGLLRIRMKVLDPNLESCHLLMPHFFFGAVSRGTQIQTIKLTRLLGDNLCRATYHGSKREREVAGTHTHSCRAEPSSEQARTSAAFSYCPRWRLGDGPAFLTP